MNNLNNRQYNMLLTMFRNNHEITLKDVSFKLKHRFSVIYELDQCINGAKTVLYVGTTEECIKALEDCINMMYTISD